MYVKVFFHNTNNLKIVGFSVNIDITYWNLFFLE